jgi:RNA polymerase sigma factor (TIGR02999 family)
MEEKKQVTRLLMDIREGDETAYSALFSAVYDQLKTIAHYQLQQPSAGKNQTLSKTDLVHEVYLKLIDHTDIEWQDRAHFYGIASRAMRQILIDYSRKKLTEKRGGKLQNLTLDEEQISLADHAEELISLNHLIDQLAQFDERKSKIVEMRFFAGMTIREISEVLQVSMRTIDRDWLKARAWIEKELKHGT